MNDSLREQLKEVCDGLDVTRELARWLIRCAEEELPELLAAARARKERFKPGVITYSPKVFLPLTNLCRDTCGYCTFRRSPQDAGAHTMTAEEVLGVARTGEKAKPPIHAPTMAGAPESNASTTN